MRSISCPSRLSRPDTDWRPLINTPPYPDHPSGLSGVISAMAQTSRDFFGTNGVGFSATSLNSMTTRSFRRDRTGTTMGTITTIGATTITTTNG